MSGWLILPCDHFVKRLYQRLEAKGPLISHYCLQKIRLTGRGTGNLGDGGTGTLTSSMFSFRRAISSSFEFDFMSTIFLISSACEIFSASTSLLCASIYSLAHPGAHNGRRRFCFQRDVMMKRRWHSHRSGQPTMLFYEAPVWLD